MREAVDFLWKRIGCLATLDGGAIPRRGSEADDLGTIEDGALAVRDGRIVAAGTTAEIESRFAAPSERTFELPGRTVLPGFVDPHTHVLFAGSREREFEMRLAGKSYMEIAAAGGGIASSVRAFREASDADLLAQSRARLDAMLAMGTTTIEAKSGYGLSVEQEIRACRLIDRLDDEHPVDLVGTFLGAHDIPPEFRSDRRAYIRRIVEEMIPEVARSTRARFCDVFCEKGVYTPEEAREILEAGRAAGLEPRLHADEFAPSGAAALAGSLRAFSADHLMEIDEEGLAAMRDGGVIAILLPATSFSMGKRRYAPAARMRELGIPIALATDCNPGSSMTTSLPLVITLAVLEMKMTVGAAITAVTVNAAASLGLESEIGRIAPGMRADLQVLRASTPAAIVYRLGGLRPERVVKAGKDMAAA